MPRHRVKGILFVLFALLVASIVTVRGPNVFSAEGEEAEVLNQTQTTGESLPGPFAGASKR